LPTFSGFKNLRVACNYLKFNKK